MKHPLYPEVLFDLSLFEHKALFDGCQFPWEALGKLEAYFAKAKLGKIAGIVDPASFLVNPELIVIGEGTVVEPGAYIKGPCIIGKGCTVRHAAYIRGNVIAGDDCVIGHGTEMKGSILLNNAHAAHFAYVGDSVLGNGVNLGAGTVLANLRFDRKEVVVKWEGERMRTGRKKLGAVLGDGAQTGCNAVLNPGGVIARFKGN